MTGEKERQKDELSLDEAIEHCFERCAEKNDSCGREHRQLGKWLQELKELRAVKYDLGPIEADGPLAVAIDRIDWVMTHIGSVLQSQARASAGAFMNVPTEFLYSAMDGLGEASRRVKEVMAGGLVFRKHAELPPPQACTLRNDQVGTHDEQRDRFYDFCNHHICSIHNCPVADTQHRSGTADDGCFDTWVGMPVSETEVPRDGEEA